MGRRPTKKAKRAGPRAEPVVEVVDLTPEAETVKPDPLFKEDPFPSLPNEIISVIFLFYHGMPFPRLEYSPLPVQVRIAKTKRTKIIQPPPICTETEVVLSHICSRWRAIALEMPSLWSRFMYIAKESYIPGNRLEVYRYRSKDRLLDFYLDLRNAKDRYEATPSRRVDFIEGIILDHRQRIRRLTLMADGDTPLTSVFPYLLPNLEAPNLEYFRVDANAYDEWDDGINKLNHDPYSFSKTSVKLSHLHLDTIAIFQVLPPLSRLTTLRIEDGHESPSHWLSSTTFLSILSLPLLVNVSLKFLDFLVWPKGQTPFGFPVTMPKLQDLRLSDSDVFQELPALLEAPLLERLTLQRIQNLKDRPDDINPFPNLKYLTLIGCHNLTTDKGANSTLAHLFPTIVSLVLSQGVRNPDCWTILSPTDDAAVDPDRLLGTWSCLRNITFAYEDPLQLDPLSRCWDKLCTSAAVTFCARKGVVRSLNQGNPVCLSGHTSEVRIFKELEDETVVPPRYWPEGYDGVDEDEFYCII